MSELRFGIIGIGNMGRGHLENFEKGKIKNGKLVAICDVNEKIKEEFPDYKFFTDYKELIDSGEVDVVIISVPHYAHTYIGIYSLEKGIHTIVEKPISVHKADCQKLIAAHTDKNIAFAAMFNQRILPINYKIKELIAQLGQLQRATMIATTWYRSQAYYNSGTWRATWDGEGGGILFNQMPHHLDLFQWFVGMPDEVSAVCNFGKYHDIEVEDEVNATLFYKNGCIGNIICTTGEYPGSFHIEIAGENGLIKFSDNIVKFYRNKQSVKEFEKVNTEDWGTPGNYDAEVYGIPGLEHLDQHAAITNNVIRHILEGEALVSPAEEGINSVELANAMILSGKEDRKVSLPLDAEEYKNFLFGLIEEKKAKAGK